MLPFSRGAETGRDVGVTIECGYCQIAVGVRVGNEGNKITMKSRS